MRQAVSLLELRTSKTLILQERKRHLQILKPVNPAPAQARLQKNQKVRPKAATVPQAGDLLLHRMPDLRANPTVKVAHRLQVGDLLLYRMPDLRATLTVEAERPLQVAHRLRTRDLLVHRTLNPRANLTVRAVLRLQGQGIKQQHLNSHRPSKVAHQRQGLPDQCRRLVAKLSRAVLLGRTFPS